MILSICICSLRSRSVKLSILRQHIRLQMDKYPGLVELLEQIDNGELPTGTKRNALYRRAQGQYVCSVDDDDWVSDYYVDEILAAAAQHPDAIAINGTMTMYGRPHATWEISKFNPYTETTVNGRLHYLRFHNHLSPVKREIAVRFPFPDQKMYEDYIFAKAMHDADAIQTEVTIYKPMYEYRYFPNKKHRQ